MKTKSMTSSQSTETQNIVSIETQNIVSIDQTTKENDFM